MEAGPRKSCGRFHGYIALDLAINNGKKFNANVQGEVPALTDKNQIKQETVRKEHLFPLACGKAFVCPQCSSGAFY